MNATLTNLLPLPENQHQPEEHHAYIATLENGKVTFIKDKYGRKFLSIVINQVDLVPFELVTLTIKVFLGSEYSQSLPGVKFQKFSATHSAFRFEISERIWNFAAEGESTVSIETL